MKTNGIKTPKEEQDHWREGEATRRPSLTKQKGVRSLVDTSPFSLLAAVSFFSYSPLQALRLSRAQQ